MVNKRIASKEEIRSYDRKWYSEHPEYRKRQIELKRIRRKKNRDYIWNYKKEKGCQKCDEKDPCCLDFHHVDATKEKCIADFNSGNWGLETIKKEIAKCIVLCANCHRKEHYYNQVPSSNG